MESDIIGEPTILAEVEIISTLIRSLKELGLDSQDFRIFINDRRILNAMLEQLKVPQDLQNSVLVVLDKRDKLPVDGCALNSQIRDLTTIRLLN